MMKVSIMIPAYNRKEYLLEVLRTLENQDCGKSLLQVIVADNGSEDGTAETLEKMKFDFSLKVLTIPREHPFEAARLRNRAAEAADGDLFLFIDSDILLPENFVSSHLKYYEGPEDLVSVIGRVYYLENKEYPRQISRISLDGLAVDPLERDYGRCNECGPTNPLIWMMYHAGNVSMTRRAFEKAGGFDEWHREWSIEDLDFGFQLYKSGVRICYSKYAYGLHKWHESGSKNAESIPKGFEYLIKKERNHALICKVYEDLKKARYCDEKHIRRTKLSILEEYEEYLVLGGCARRDPVLTIAIYSPSFHEELFSLLDSLNGQYNGKFEVLIADDSSSIEKNARLQRRSFCFPCRFFQVNWNREKKDHVMARLQYKRLCGLEPLSEAEKILLDRMEEYLRQQEESLKRRFEELVYDQALGMFVKLLDDQTQCGPGFIQELWRDLICEEGEEADSHED